MPWTTVVSITPPFVICDMSPSSNTTPELEAQSKGTSAGSGKGENKQQSPWSTVASALHLSARVNGRDHLDTLLFSSFEYKPG